MALALGLAAAGSWGLAGFAGGLAARRVGALVAAAGAQGVGLVIVVVALALAGPPMPALRELLPALGGGLAGGLGLIALFRALAIGPMGLVAPVAGTGVAVPVTAGFLGGERLGALPGCGVALAVLGVVVATRRVTPAPGTAASPRSGLWFAVLAAGLFGLFYLGLEASGEADVLWTVTAARSLSVAFLTAWAALCARRRARTPAPARPAGGGRVGHASARAAVVASGVLDVAGNALFTLATTRGLLVLAAVPAALYPLVTLLCARVLLAERLRPAQRAGVGLALAGVALMATPA